MESVTQLGDPLIEQRRWHEHKAPEQFLITGKVSEYERGLDRLSESDFIRDQHARVAVAQHREGGFQLKRQDVHVGGRCATDAPEGAAARQCC